MWNGSSVRVSNILPCKSRRDCPVVNSSSIPFSGQAVLAVLIHQAIHPAKQLVCFLIFKLVPASFVLPIQRQICQEWGKVSAQILSRGPSC